MGPNCSQPDRAERAGPDPGLRNFFTRTLAGGLYHFFALHEFIWIKFRDGEVFVDS